MSTTGHYTRYINQYPGWSDNCDTMHQPVYDGVRDCEKCGISKPCNLATKKQEYCQKQIGSLTVEHTAGNLYALCRFDSWVYNREDPDPKIRFTIYEYHGKKAIQNVLEKMATFPNDQLIQMIKCREAIL